MSDFPGVQALVSEAFSLTTKSKVSQDDLIIWGGNLEESQLNVFLESWQDILADTLPWRMVEEVDQFYVQRTTKSDATLPKDLTLVERMRIFGEKGDLDLRRDGATFQWRFIGERNGAWPDLTAFDPVDFWDEHEDTEFQVVPEKYYQWRRTKDEQRVTSDWLHNNALPKQNAYLEQVHYFENGLIAFVRYTGLKE